MRKIALFATLLIFSFEFSILHSQKTLMSPSAALKTLEIRDGRCQEESLHAFVTLSEGTDLKAFDAYGVKVNSAVPLSHHSSLITSQLPESTLSRPVTVRQRNLWCFDKH